MKKRILKTFANAKAVAVIAVAVAVVVVVAAVFHFAKTTKIEVASDNSISITPEQIQAIRAIGEWEFLSVSTEEMVDTMRRGLFSDDHLVRIYYGTLRLGVNLHKTEPGWLVAQGDTVFVTLPAVGLLDNDFIDEARTRSFFESGRWQAQDREALYRKAYNKMIAHCLTPSNIRSAEKNADAQFRNMMRSMGFNNVVVRFKKK